jgi:hypothetical protein
VAQLAGLGFGLFLLEAEVRRLKTEVAVHMGPGVLKVRDCAGSQDAKEDIDALLMGKLEVVSLEHMVPGLNIVVCCDAVHRVSFQECIAQRCLLAIYCTTR